MTKQPLYEKILNLMASSPRHFESDIGPHEYKNGNGRGVNEKCAREWLHIEGPLTWFSLLNIHPLEQDPERIRNAALDREVSLAPHLQNEVERAEAHRIAKEIERIEDTLLNDPAARRTYLRELQRSYPRLLITDQSEETHEALAQQLPKVVLRPSRHPGLLQSIPAWVKRNRILAGVSTIVLAGVTSVFALRGKEEPSRETNASSLQQTDTPALPKQPLPAPTPPPAPIELAANKPDSRLQQPTTATPAETKESAPPQTPVPAKQPAAPAPSAATSAHTVSKEPLQDQQTIPEHQEPARLSVPDKASLGPYLDLLENSTLRQQSAEQLLQQSRNTKIAEERWMLLRVALLRAQEEHDLDGIVSIRQEFQNVFEVTISPENEREARMKAIREASLQKGLKSEVMMRHISDVIRNFYSEDQYDEARSFLSELQRRPTVDRRQMLELSRLTTRFKKACEVQGVPAAKKVLARSPEDSDANRTVAMFRFFEQGNRSYLPVLRSADDPQLRKLMERIDGRMTLPASDLLKLANDIITRSSGPGAVAMALECCALAEPKAADSAVLKARIKDLCTELVQNPVATLPIFHDTLSGPLKGSALENARNDAFEHVPGAVNMIGEDVKGLFQKGYSVRDRWVVAPKEGKEILMGYSGHQTWVASIAFPLAPECQKIVQNGQYTCRFIFKRASDYRHKGALQGATSFMIPLPNGQSIGIFWDANMDTTIPGYRSGFDPEGLSFFDKKRRDTSAFADHAHPIISEDGTAYVCTVSVCSNPKGILITALVAEHASEASSAKNPSKKILAHFSLAAPPTVRGASYLFKDADRKVPAEMRAPWGPGVGGGSILLIRADIKPDMQERQARAR